MKLSRFAELVILLHDRDPIIRDRAAVNLREETLAAELRARVGNPPSRNINKESTERIIRLCNHVLTAVAYGNMSAEDGGIAKAILEGLL